MKKKKDCTLTLNFKEGQPRDSKGRFCTLEQRYIESVINENKKLRVEKEKYYRTYLSLARSNVYLEKKIMSLKKSLTDLLNGLR